MRAPEELGPAPSSFGVDLSAERALLNHHDIPRLTRRLHRSLRRWAWARGAAFGAAASAAVGLLVWFLSRDTSPDASAASMHATPGPAMLAADADPSLTAPPTVLLRAPRAALPTASEESPLPRAEARPTQRSTTRETTRDTTREAPGIKTPVDAASVPEAPEYHLRAQLRLFERAHEALAAGALEDARAALDDLDARYPSGALSVEADVLRARLAPPQPGAEPERPRSIVGGDGP